jgi:hypothetical protein
MFWSILLPEDLANPMLTEAAEDSEIMTSMIADHLCTNLG